MEHHDRRPGGVARPELDDMQRGAGDLDHAALRRKTALQEQDTGLRDQRQHGQRRHDGD